MRSKKTFETFTGLGVAVITPFKENNNVDLETLNEIVEHLIGGGVDYLVALGSTGESNLLSKEEQNQVLKQIIKSNSGRLPVVAGHFSGISTQEIIQGIQDADLEGVDALMISSPSYVKPSQQGIYEHYMQIAKECPLPIIIYNVPGRTKSNIEASTLVRLANDSNAFIGVKEASGNLHQIIDILRARPEHFFLTSGDDDLALAAIAHGGEGLISVVGNVLPREASAMIHQALHGDYKEAAKIQFELYDVYDHIYSEGNPTGIKSAMEIIGFGNRRLRLPLVALSDTKYLKLKDVIHRIEGSIA